MNNEHKIKCPECGISVPDVLEGSGYEATLCNSCYDKTEQKHTPTRIIAYRIEGRGRWYVSGVPHPKGTRIALKEGVDWGYDKAEGKAIELSLYWARRFKRDCQRVNAASYFIDLSTNQFCEEGLNR